MEKTISYQNKKIFYRSYGTGKTVMLVHGFGEDGNIWKNQIEFLKEKFHIIVPDLPGSGQSKMIDDMSIEGMAEVLHEIIHEELKESSKITPSGGGGPLLATAWVGTSHLHWQKNTGITLMHSVFFIQQLLPIVKKKNLPVKKELSL